MKRDCDNGHHAWEYSSDPYGTAPYPVAVKDGNERHIVDIECKECGQQGIEVYTFNGIEELNEN
jgi:hypothetical protein